MDYENWISRLKYKSDWTFFYLHNEWGHWLQIQAKVTCSRRTRSAPSVSGTLNDNMQTYANLTGQTENFSAEYAGGWATP